MSTDEIRTLSLKGKITKKRLVELGYTKVFGYKIPLELCTDEELKEAWRYCRSCAEEAAFFDNARKSDILYNSCDQIDKEIREAQGHFSRVNARGQNKKGKQ